MKAKRSFLLQLVALMILSIACATAYAGSPNVPGMDPGTGGDSYPAREIGNISVTIAPEGDVNMYQNGDDWVWRPATQNTDHPFKFTVMFDVAGAFEYTEQGSIEVRIPLHILKDAAGDYADRFEIGLPRDDATGIEADNKFVYKVDEQTQEIVIYNITNVPAGTHAWFDVAYYTTKATYNYPDYDPQKTVSTDKHASDPFKAKIVMYDNGVQAGEKTSNEIPVYINTKAEVTQVKKSALNTLYDTWQESWGDRPDQADEYYYLIWEVRSYISATQTYDFSIEDSVSSANDDFEVVGFRMAGQSGFTSAANGGGQLTGQTATYPNGRVDNVLTRHRQSTYQDLERYELTNTATTAVHPKDGVDTPDTTQSCTAKYTFVHPVFQKPSPSKFVLNKEGLDHRNSTVMNSNYIRSFALDSYKTHASDEISDLLYSADIGAFAYALTLKDGGDPNNYLHYGVTPISFELIDETVQVKDLNANSFSAPLNPGEYKFNSVRVGWSAQGADYDSSSMSFKPTAPTYGDNEKIELYIKTADGWSAVPVATFAVKNRANDTHDASLVSVNGTTVTFLPDAPDVIGYKLLTSNKHYTTSITSRPNITLLRSETLDQAVADAYGPDDSGRKHIAVMNTVQGKYYKGAEPSEEGLIRSDSDSGVDYVAGIQRHGYIKKDVRFAENSIARRQITLTWMVNAYEWYASDNTSRLYVPQESGVFYDLLPLNCVLDASSLSIWNNKGRLQPGQFTYEVKPNYKNGRDLLVVRMMDSSATGYSMSYNTIHLWDSILELTDKTAYNHAAYQTGNPDIGDGYADNGGPYHALMANLDQPANGSAKRFLYHDTQQTLNVLMAGELGLYKKVSAAGDQGYSYSTVTNSGNAYSYKVRMATDPATRAKDLIFFDSLENYVLTDGKTSEWQGCLTGINTSVLQNEYHVDAQVYYSTADNLDITAVIHDGEGENYDFADHTDIWTPAGSYSGDMKDVHAWAVDARKTTAGANFVLPVRSAVSFTVNMTAPTGLDSDALEPKAYNNIYLYNALKLSGQESFGDGTLNHQDYTEIQFRQVADLHLLKIDEEAWKNSPKDDRQIAVIPGAIFRLFGESFYGDVYDVERTSNSQGLISFEDVPRGTYTLVEQPWGGAKPDYMPNFTAMTVTVDQNGNAYIGPGNSYEEMELYDGFVVFRNQNQYADYPSGTYFAVNKPYIYGNVEFLKRGRVDDTDDTRLLDGVTFKLTGTSIYGTEYSDALSTAKYAVSTNGGHVVFEDIERSNPDGYTMVEVTTVNGYILSDLEFIVRIDAVGAASISYIGENGEEVLPSQNGRYLMAQNGSVVIVNDPLHRFSLWKYNAISMAPAAGAVFSLTGTDPGSAYYAEETTSAAGLLTFSGLLPGSYQLQEKEPAPQGYEYDDTIHDVEVDEDGNVTVDGLTLTQFQQQFFGDYFGGQPQDNMPNAFPIPNKPPFTGEISIVKLWDDEDGARPIPVLHLDATKPAAPAVPSATISRDKWNRIVKQRSTNPLNTLTTFEEWLQPVADPQVNGWERIDDETDPDNSVWYKVIDNVGYWYSEAVKVYLPEDCSALFEGAFTRSANSPEVFTLGRLDTSKVTNMEKMFRNIFTRGSGTLYPVLDLSGLNTSNVTSMKSMFEVGDMYSRSSSTSDIIMTGWDTSKVQDMSCMFRLWRGGASLDFSGFDTSSVKTMEEMFRKVSMPIIDLRSFNFGNVENLGGMLRELTYTNEIKLPEHVNSSRCTNFSSMFFQGSGIRLDISGLDTSAGEDFSSMFTNFSSASPVNGPYRYPVLFGLENLDLSNARTLDHMFYMFWFTRGDGVTVKELDMSGWNIDPDKLKNIDAIFRSTRFSTIYASEDWPEVPQVTPDSFMVYNAPFAQLYSAGLKGGNGTRWDGTYTNSTYAKIDRPGVPGYFTYKAPPARVKISGDTGLTNFPADDLQPMFTYTLSEGDTVLSTVQYRGAGRYAFPFINYTEPGPHTYTVKMVNTGDDGMTYDETVHTVTVNVTSGTDPFGFGKPVLTATVIEVDGQPASSASGLNFSTSYTAPAQPGGNGGSGEEQPGAQVVGDQVSDDGKWFYQTNEGWEWLGDDRWAYTFNVYEEDFTYYLWESPMSGYTTDTGMDSPVTIQYHKASGETPGYITTNPAHDRLIEYPEGSGKYYALITNEKGENEAGLRVKKVVTGDGSKTMEYPITVTLYTDAEGTAVANTITGQFGEMKFGNGVSSFGLKHNESRTATGLPVGSTGLWYKVEEGDFEGKGEYTVTIAPAQGTVEVSPTPVVIVTNHKSEEAKGGLKIKKVVAGDTTEDDMNRTFQLTVTLYTDSARTQEAEINGQYGDLKFDNGVAVKALKHGDEFTAQGIPLGDGLWYKVEETEVTGFTATYEGELGQVSDTLPIAVVTNSKDPTGGFSLKKAVSGGNAGDTFSLTVYLQGLAAGTAYPYQFNGVDAAITAGVNGAASVTLEMEGGDRADFSGLPINATYQVNEATSAYVPAYQITNAGTGGSIAKENDEKFTPEVMLTTAWETVEEDEEILITYTNTYPTVVIEGHKSWEVPAGVTVPDSIKVWLFADGNLMDSQEIGEAKEWKYSFTGLNKYEGSREIVYSVLEDDLSGKGFIGSYNGYDITNTYSELIDVSVHKVWDDNNDQDGIRPQQITLQLKADGVTKYTLQLPKEDGSWSHTFTGLPRYKEENGELVEIEYTITENPIIGYSTEYEPAVGVTGGSGTIEITNKHIPEVTTITVNKSWDDSNDQDGLRSRVNASVYLYKRIGTNYPTFVQRADNPKPVGTEDGRSYTWADLPKYENGEEIQYSVEERIDGSSDYRIYPDGQMNIESGGSGTLVNRHVPATKNIAVTKTWSDSDDQDGIRPPQVTIRLWADSAEVDSATLPQTNGSWNHLFTDLPKYKNEGGVVTEIVYTVTEDEVQGYTANITKE